MSYKLLFSCWMPIWIVYMGGARSLRSAVAVCVAVVRYRVPVTVSGLIFSNTSSMEKF